MIERSRRRDGREIARLGIYDPLTSPHTVKVNREQFDLWVKRGAQASDTVRTIVLGEKPKEKRKPRKKSVTEKPEIKPEESKPENKKESA